MRGKRAGRERAEMRDEPADSGDAVVRLCRGRGATAMKTLVVVLGLVMLCAAPLYSGRIMIPNWTRAHERDPDLWASLTRDTTDPNAEVRVRAIEELARLRDGHAIGTISRLLDDRAVVKTRIGPTPVAALGCAALGVLSDPNAVPHLIPLLDDPDLHEAACKALEYLRGGGRSYHRELTALLAADDLRDGWCGCDPLNWRAWWTWRGLSGREVIVRLYKAPHIDPTAYELVRARVISRSVPLGTIPGADPCSVVVICGTDQEEQDLQVLMGQWVTARRGSERKGCNVPDRLWRIAGGDAIPARWTIEDALGRPIPGASVEVWLRPGGSVKGGRVQFGRWQTPDGTIEAYQFSSGYDPSFAVSHPDYGNARVRAILPEQSRLRVPLVRMDSEAGRRSVWGTVVDESGQPLAGARVRCGGVRTLGGGQIRPDLKGAGGEVVTDANGFFCLYMTPDERHPTLRGGLIPPGSRFLISVHPPAGIDLLPYQGDIVSGSAEYIVLRGLVSRNRRLVFRIGGETVRDPAALERISLEIQPLRGPVRKYDYAQWSGGDPMPEGRYTATLEVDGFKRTFGPTIVSASQEMVYLSTRPTLCSGRVVNARTGRPVPRAFVLIRGRRGNGRFSDLTPEQWGRIEQLDERTPADHEALTLLERVFGSGRFVRTDADGRYEVSPDSGASGLSMVCFARDFVPVRYNTGGLVPDLSGRVELPPVDLFPAAWVQIHVRADGVRSGIAVKWQFDPNQVPTWAQSLCAKRRDGWFSQEYAYGCAADRDEIVYVPAYVPLQLTLRPPRMSRLSSYTYSQTLCLPQGAFRDLGPCSLPKAVPVVVQVVDERGRPVEGVPIQFMARHGALEGLCNSDAHGLVTLYVPPHSSGRIGVFPHIPLRRHPSWFEPETVPFEVGAAEEKNERFTLVLSDALRMFLFDRSN